jgi:hypothetical protein
MNPTANRPIGVTLIAISFLWIGCFGALAFPFIALSGGTTLLWDHILGASISSAFWVRVVSSVLSGLWFLAYLAYAVIGFGLWKLKNWARRSVLVIIALGIVAGIVVSIIFVRPILLGMCVLGGTALEFGWLAWYLMRPRVRYAFGMWNGYSSTGEWIEPLALSKRGRYGVGAVAVASIIILFIVPLFVAVETMMESSGAYKLAMRTAQASPCVVQSLGSPIKSGWAMSGSIEESGDDGSANLSIPISGPRGKGDIEVEAKKIAGIWTINSLIFSHGPTRSSIIPQEQNQDCR